MFIFDISDPVILIITGYLPNLKFKNQFPNMVWLISENSEG